MSPNEQNPDLLPWPSAQDGEWLSLMCGNQDAVQFVLDIAYWSHIYDDLIDRDKPVSDETIHKVMWKVMIGLPMNPFYRLHQDMLRPLIITGIINWHAANQMEQSGCTEQLRVAHVTRHSIGDIALMAMALAGGQDHAIKNAHRCRLLMQTGSWAQYRQEHSNADPE
jgi:hypothetical protein